jgi:chromate transporter
VTLQEATRVWASVAAQSFGGPAGQIAVLHRLVVEERAWISEARFLHALNFCMLLPGPEAQQLTTYVGWLLHGVRGGLVAGGLFILPGFVSILAISLLHAVSADAPLVLALLGGLQAAVLAVIAEAVLRLGRRVLRNAAMGGMAVASFLALFVGEVPFPVVVLGAGALGLVGARLAPGTFVVLSLPGANDPRTHVAPPPLVATLRTVAVWGAVWAAPLVLVGGLWGTESLPWRLGTFFSGAAVVTFGGAYAVLAYLAQQAVEVHGWVTADEMLQGLAVAEATPGPLIQVVQFVGFRAAWNDPGLMPPWLAGTLASVLVTWVTFAPCFLWIFALAPYVEWLRGHRGLTAALSAITAAVVGVVAQLGVWLGLQVLFGTVHTLRPSPGVRLLVPELASLDPVASVIAVGASVALLRWHRSMGEVLGGGAVVGLLAGVVRDAW